MSPSDSQKPGHTAAAFLSGKKDTLEDKSAPPPSKHTSGTPHGVLITSANRPDPQRLGRCLRNGKEKNSSKQTRGKMSELPEVKFQQWPGLADRQEEPLLHLWALGWTLISKEHQLNPARPWQLWAQERSWHPSPKQPVSLDGCYT